MKEQEIQASSGLKVRIVSLKSVMIARKTGFWYDESHVYQFIPSGAFGFVLAELVDASGKAQELGRWLLYRPAALELKWDKNTSVDFVDETADFFANVLGDEKGAWTVVRNTKR